MVAVVVMVLDEEVKSGEGEGEGEGWGTTELKQASSELAGSLFSTVIMPKRSRPDDAALVPPSEGANGSFGGQKWVGKKNVTHGKEGRGMLDNDSETKQSGHTVLSSLRHFRFIFIM